MDFTGITIHLEEEERQFLLLSLALTALSRPGFSFMAHEIAKKLEGEEMYKSFMRSNCPKSSRAIALHDFSL